MSAQEVAMEKLVDPRGSHEWSSDDYVNRWAERQDTREPEREEPFQLLADTIPAAKDARIKILDVGAGYGGLTRFLLERFPNATAVCHDGSEEMYKLGSERMELFKGRFNYVLSDFSKPGWSKVMKDQFEAVVSSIAIHNVRGPEIIESIYNEIFALVKPGGCFLNFDRLVPSEEELLGYLKKAGFKDVECFWQNDARKRGVFGGFKR